MSCTEGPPVQEMACPLSRKPSYKLKRPTVPSPHLFDSLPPRVHVQLCIDALQVALRGSLADEEPGGNFRRGRPEHEQGKNFDFPARKLWESVCDLLLSRTKPRCGLQSIKERHEVVEMGIDGRQDCALLVRKPRCPTRPVERKRKRVFRLEGRQGEHETIGSGEISNVF